MYAAHRRTITIIAIIIGMVYILSSGNANLPSFEELKFMKKRAGGLGASGSF
jgi:hypothetical protein